jgi:hypothetical protein
MLAASNAQRYEPTSTDRVWLLRAVAAEGKPHAGVAQALVNLFMLRRSRGSLQTLATLVRSYAQPVNPRWFTSGDLFKAAPRTAAQRMTALQRENVHSVRTAFPSYVLAAVDDALARSFPSDVTDYAAPDVDASAKYESRSEPTAGENRFWSRAPGWAGYMANAAGAPMWPMLDLAIFAAAFFLLTRDRA